MWHQKWVALVAVLGLGLCTSALADVKPVRIGLVGPFEAGTMDIGNSMRFGAELAVKEINEFGGYLGRPLELVVRDDRSDPGEGRRHAEDLVLKERVDFTIGYCNTGVGAKAIDVFQSHQHLLMIPCSTGTVLTHKYPARESVIFRVGPNDALKARFLVEEIVDRRRQRRVAILADDSGYGEGGVQDLSVELARKSLQPVYVGRFSLNVSSLETHLKAARQAGAQALIVYTVPKLQIVALKSRVDLGWQVPYYSTWALSSRDVREQAGIAALEGTMMVQTIIHDMFNERRTSFLARYYKHSHEKRIGSLMAAAQAYDAVHLMLRALFEAKGETRGAALKQALENLPRPYQGVVTTYRQPFDVGDHDAIAINMLWLGVWRKGEIEYESRDDAKRAGLVREKQKVALSGPLAPTGAR